MSNETEEQRENLPTDEPSSDTPEHRTIEEWCNLFAPSEAEKEPETSTRTLKLKEGKSERLKLDTNSLEHANTVRDQVREWFGGAEDGTGTSDEGLGLVSTSVKINEEDDVTVDVAVKAANVGFGSADGPSPDEYPDSDLPDTWLVVVEPKLEDVAIGPLIAMAAAESDLAEMLHVDTDADVELDRASQLLPALLAMYERALDGFFDRGQGLRRLHRTRKQTFKARRRGKLRVGRYMRNISRGQPLDVPCRHPSHEIDNLPNRTLLTALDILLRAAGRSQVCHDTDRVTECLASLRGYRRRFDGVSDDAVQPTDLRDLDRLPDGFSHYNEHPENTTSGPLPLARWIVRNLRFERRAGSARMPGLSVTMWEVFENAFATLMRRTFGSDRVHTQGREQDWSYRLESRSGDATTSINKGYEPDVYVEPADDEPPLILDTKWKSVYPSAEDNGDAEGAENEKDRAQIKNSAVKNSDINQILAYAHLVGEKDEKKPVAALVYPSAPAPSAQTNRSYPLHIHDVTWGDEAKGTTEGNTQAVTRLSLRLTFWDVVTSACDDPPHPVEVLNKLSPGTH